VGRAFDELVALVVAFEDEMTRGLTDAGLTVPRAHLLWTLRAGGPQTQQALSVAVGVTPRHITGLVDGLVRTGFVRRDPHPGDRRALLVSLTDHGTAVTTDLAADQAALGQQLFGDLDPDRLRAFVETTTLIAGRLQQARAGGETLDRTALLGSLE